MKSALITGILGQDGTYLARWLLRQGYQVHGLIRRALPAERARIHARFPEKERRQIRFHTAVLEDANGLARVVKAAKPDEVYHLAGVSDSRQSFLIPAETFESITLGSLRLLEAGRRSGKATRFFLASSCEVFGVPPHRPQTERTPRAPLTPYGISKEAADRLAGLYRNSYGQFVATGILYNHESPLRPAKYLSSRVAQAVAAIKKGTLHELTVGTLDAQRDWSDARDFVRGFHLALQAREPADYIFASGQTHTVAEFIEYAFRVVGLDYQDFVRVDAKSVGTVPVPSGLCGNARRAERVLGWRREWSLADTIADMVQAELEQRPPELRSDPSPRRRSMPKRPSRLRSLPRKPRLQDRR
jgi:GDPmannose 4,6-dehydratase